MTRTFGIDVSHWQGAINWKQAVAGGARFAFVKCSEKSNTDARFLTNWREAEAAGLMRGAYCFGNYNFLAAPQAEYFCSMLEKHGRGELPPVLDVEVMYKQVYNAETKKYDKIPIPLPPRLNLLKWIDDFCLTVYQRIGYRALLYTNPEIIKHLSPIPADLMAHDLWLAHYLYPTSIALGWEPTYKPWSRWTFWQWTDRENGERLGTTSKQVDGNYFNGSFDNLVAYSQSYTGGAPVITKTIDERLARLESEAKAHGWNV